MEDGRSQFGSMVWFVGVVEDVNDPLLINRVRVRCVGYHPKDKTLLPTKSLPWAPFISSTAQMSAPMVNQGDWVIGFFIDGQLAQQPVVIGSYISIPEAAANPNEGFFDPSGIHPRLLNEGTNSRHARGEEGTPDRNAIAYTKSSATASVSAADGTKFTEPLSQFDARYPYNHVMETDRGHVFELDDTPDAERVQIFHRKGSFVEFHPDGTVVHRAVNDRYQITLESDNTYVGNTMNMSVVGSVNIVAGANTNISTGGDVTWRVGGNMRMDIGGNFDVAVGGTTNIDSGDTAIIYSGGNVELQGSQVHFNKPTPKPLDSIKSPEIIEKSSGGPTVFEILATDDDIEKSPDEINSIRTSAGLKPIDTKPPSEGDSATPAAGGGDNKDVKCGSIQLKDDYRQVKISKNFTLADMTQGGSRKLQAAGGASVEDILCNLVKLAENILEPIKNAGLKFTITSAYRQGSGKSDHDVGRAVDIKVHGMTNFQAAQKVHAIVGGIAKQFLLEYTTSGGSGWIHIAYNGGSKSALPLATFNNHSTYARNKFVDLKPAVVA
ncbi:hypothetical protein OAU13_00985 [bacterium]|nr:hypothetical protein [bacterium]